MKNLYVGTAAWTIPIPSRESFPAEGSHLERYAMVFNGVEINTAFYRQHLAKSYQRWSNLVNSHFRFSVKLFRELSHRRKLDVSFHDIRETLLPILELKDKLGVLLVQLAPSLSFNELIARRFFSHLREIYHGSLVCEPRHSSWTQAAALKVFKDFSISKVIADPELCPVTHLSEWMNSDTVYFRLHGSPDIYKSKYSDDYLKGIQQSFVRWREKKSCWCIFDNTTYGHATENALTLSKMISLEKFPSQASKNTSLFDEGT